MTLREFFKTYPRVAVAFSGGVDSAFVLYAARKYADRVRAYYVRSEFQPEFEQQDAARLAKELDADMRILSLQVLDVPGVRDNPPDRCYHCKKTILGAIAEAARADGFTVLLDGTNASDGAGDRPGMRALREFSVLSPLRECGLTKDRIRQLSREAGLFTWDKPAYACLATRIPTGEEITERKLAATESAEAYMFSLGFTDFRVRSRDGHAVLQLPESQTERLWRHRKEILERLKADYRTVSLDLEVRG
ncbi:MAG: ATP-dependent sacrificial sulfur transferase LarE [Clostridium sp.]|nr:ATP-dependent sacrificial sulfur transferase LarE [Acetatifactor muris]MCM1528195.1 ATP-dependent sacrificial sulfur transferase LarE [Bacteroides sp.]MCM1564264.1 ATP-dependent sacrificial sulfur transferase LarE [Clostridium sp.]